MSREQTLFSAILIILIRSRGILNSHFYILNFIVHIVIRREIYAYNYIICATISEVYIFEHRIRIF